MVDGAVLRAIFTMQVLIFVFIVLLFTFLSLALNTLQILKLIMTEKELSLMSWMVFLVVVGQTPPLIARIVHVMSYF